MHPFSSESATLPRGFRFHYQDGQRPKTPEPAVINEIQQPSPPRPTRLKVKRRNVSQFSGPTEQFLASVAAADVPIPSIELPVTAGDTDMLDLENTPQLSSGFLAPRIPDYRTSPPKTPLPQLITSMDEAATQRPDWYMEAPSPPPDNSSRPGSSLSNPSDWSDDSYFSVCNISRPSEDGSCTSPDSDITDPFAFASMGKGKGKEFDPANEPIKPQQKQTTVLNGHLRSRSRKNAPWTRDMSDHLWHTYQVYLQDPTVTPFRIGASAVPPEGVIHRVAREAKRSWRGPKGIRSQNHTNRRASSLTLESSIGSIEIGGSPTTSSTSKSGSLTPTGESPPKIYVQWMHSSATTRNHLRDLCKKRDSTSVQTHRHLQSRSPTPFTQSRSWEKGRLPTPAHSQKSSFSTKDIALSLTTSTSDSMQPDGPLALLSDTMDTAVENSVPLITLNEKEPLGLGISIESDISSRRLGSPFSARTYGPSSSKTLGSLGRPSQLRNFSDTDPASNVLLASPFIFNQSRSLNGTQKRRAQNALEEELSPNGAVLRPSILDEQLFGGPPQSSQRRVRTRGFSLGDEALRNRIPGLFERPSFIQRTPLHDATSVSSNTTSSSATPSLLPSATFDPPPEGRNFTESGPNNTFPRRVFQPLDGTATIRKRPFATVHHSRRSIESFDFGEGLSLQSRLSQLDQKLAEIRDRETANYSRQRD